MDKATISGIVLALIGIGTGMALKGVSPLTVINPAALLIILLGTAASVCIAFPMATLKNIPVLLKIVFTTEKNSDLQAVTSMFTNWAELSKREGILALEKEMETIEDSFLASGLQHVLDGQSSEYVRDLLLEKINAMEERHQKGASVFSQAGTYAPTLGVLGAVIGLIAALGNMEDIEALGHAISAAFIATLLGIFTGYILWHPFANKLKEKSENEIRVKMFMIEGLLSIANGENPQLVNDKLSSYLSSKELAKMDLEESDETEKTA